MNTIQTIAIATFSTVVIIGIILDVNGYFSSSSRNNRRCRRVQSKIYRYMEKRAVLEARLNHWEYIRSASGGIPSYVAGTVGHAKEELARVNYRIDNLTDQLNRIDNLTDQLNHINT